MVANAILMVAALVGAHAQQPTSKQLIEKMLGRYYAANTLTGKIRLTVATASASVSMDTDIQFERPAKLYIKQQKNSANPDPDQPTSWLVTSDGVKFTYEAPAMTTSLGGAKRGTRLRENVFDARSNTTHDVRSIYLAAGRSLGDRSMPLDIAIARTDDLRFRRNQWIDHRMIGSKEVRGKTAYIVKGSYQTNLGAGPSGTYQMLISAEGDLLQYVEDTNVDVDGKVIEIKSQWDVDIVIDGPVNQALFKVVN